MSAGRKHEKQRSWIRSALLGAAAGIAVGAALLAILSALIAKGKLPEDMMKQLLTAACFVSGMFAALAAGRANGARSLPVGLAASAALTCAVIIAGLATGRGELLNKGALILSAALLAGGAAGGTIGAMNAKGKR